MIFLPRDKADPFTFHLKLFKQTWPSLSCHGPWKGHYTACPPASLPTASMEAGLCRTDTKIEWVTRWQNRKSRLVNWIEPFYPQRKGRCQASGGFEMAKVKTCSAKRPGWRDLQMRSSVIWLKNTETKMKFCSLFSVAKAAHDRHFADQKYFSEEKPKTLLWCVISPPNAVKFALCLFEVMQVHTDPHVHFILWDQLTATVFFCRILNVLKTQQAICFVKKPKTKHFSRSL